MINLRWGSSHPGLQDFVHMLDFGNVMKMEERSCNGRIKGLNLQSPPAAALESDLVLHNWSKNDLCNAHMQPSSQRLITGLWQIVLDNRHNSVKFLVCYGHVHLSLRQPRLFHSAENSTSRYTHKISNTWHRQLNLKLFFIFFSSTRSLEHPRPRVTVVTSTNGHVFSTCSLSLTGLWSCSSACMMAEAIWTWLSADYMLQLWQQMLQKMCLRIFSCRWNRQHRI